MQENDDKSYDIVNYMQEKDDYCVKRRRFIKKKV